MLVICGISIYYYIADNKKGEEKQEEIKIIDDRISPYTNQGLMVEILRIRNRGLLEKMMSFGTSWKNKPSFYYLTKVDGKEANVKGNVGEQGVYTDWDTFGQESLDSFYIEEEQKTSRVTISIIEQKTSGLIFKKTNDVEIEKINLEYDYRTGRWKGDDKLYDSDGYGHYVGDNYEVWFNLYQSDYDQDGIPFFTEVNILRTDPTIDDSELDPDCDGIPTDWEWKYGYDPFTYNDHKNLDPDIDGIQNDEEYFMRKRLANPYQPDFYIETDGMEKKGLFDLNHIFFKESQQMIIERMCQHGINVYIDDGSWPDSPVNGGGETLPFHIYLDDVIGKQLMGFYKHNFPDERKGIFRYVIAGYKYAGFITTCDYNHFDAVHVGNNIYDTFIIRRSITPRTIRLTFASAVLHELGHSMGLLPITFEGNDIMNPVGVRYPSMDPGDYEKFLEQYHSIMNYKYTYEKTLFDFSDGSNGPPYDQNDWDVIYLPSFEIDSLSYEEAVDETFEDFEVSNEYPGIVLKGWEYDEDLTEKYAREYKDLEYEKTSKDTSIKILKRVDVKDENQFDIRVYAKPEVDPVYSIYSLIAEGKLNKKDDSIKLYSFDELYDEAINILNNQ